MVIAQNAAIYSYNPATTGWYIAGDIAPEQKCRKQFNIKDKHSVCFPIKMKCLQN